MTTNGEEVGVNFSEEEEDKIDSDNAEDKDPAEQTTEIQSDTTTEQLAESLPTDQATEQPIEPPATDQTIEQPLESSPGDQTTEQPIESSRIDQTTEQPIERSPGDQTTEQPIEPPATDQTIEQPIESSPGDQTTEQPIESSPGDKTTEQPIESLPGDQTIEQPIEPSPTDQTIEQPIESSPGDKTTEQPIEPSATDQTIEHPLESSPGDQTTEQPIEPSPIDKTTEQPIEPSLIGQTTEQEPSLQQKSDDRQNGEVNGVKCWPERVVVTSTNWTGYLGTHFHFHIDAKKGGPGLLTAFCTGASRRAHCELRDQHNGTFTLVVKPEEIGNHVLDVRYEDEPVEGSPFTFRVAANTRPDAKKVRVSGPGVENGILSTFQSKFVVDTLGAGAGNLSVRMQGPRGAFQMEMHRASQSDRKVLCYYNPTFSGVYIIVVKWSGVNVPGSPFQVKIFDSEFEMEKDARGYN